MKLKVDDNLRRLVLAADFFVEEFELFLNQGNDALAVWAIIARHKHWREEHGLHRREAVFIPLGEGGATGRCRLCERDVPADDQADHLTKGCHHLPTTSRSGE